MAEWTERPPESKVRFMFHFDLQRLHHNSSVAPGQLPIGTDRRRSSLYQRNHKSRKNKNSPRWSQMEMCQR